MNILNLAPVLAAGIDTGLVTIISSIAGVIMVSVLVALVKVITTFVNKNMIDSFNISKGFIRRKEFTELKNELKKEMAVERLALQELLTLYVGDAIEGKIRDIKNINNRLDSVDDTIEILRELEDDFKDKVSSMNLAFDDIATLKKELNKIKYGTENPTNEQIERRHG